MIGKLELLVIDCPDPKELARFYSKLVGAEIVGWEDDWTEIAFQDGRHPIIAFQRVDDYSPPQWPGQTVPQQMHLDVRVDDLDAGEQEVLALGATKAGSQTPTFRVYLDPAGHPFCLINPSD